MAKKRSYGEILEELVEWEMHELMEAHSAEELKTLKEKFESHRQELVQALEELEKKGKM